MGTRIDTFSKNFVYDPTISGLDSSFWKTVAGSDPTIVSSKLQFAQNDEIASYGCHKYLDVEFIVTVPTAPTAGHSRSWGLKSPALGDRARIEFDITDDVFKAKVFGDDGTALLNATISWDAEWTAAATKFRIKWDRSGIHFLIDGTEVAATSAGQAVGIGVPLHAKNGVNDAFAITAVVVSNDQSLT